MWSRDDLKYSGGYSKLHANTLPLYKGLEHPQVFGIHGASRKHAPADSEGGLYLIPSTVLCAEVARWKFTAGNGPPKL